MKEFFRKNRFKIIIIITLVFVICTYCYLSYFHDFSLAEVNLDIFYNSFFAGEKFFTTAILGVILLGLFINFLSNRIFTSANKKTLENTEKILEQQKGSNENVNAFLKIIEYDPRELKKWVEKLPNKDSIEKQKVTINDWYDRKEIDIKLKETLEIVISHKKESIEALKELIKNSSNSDYTAVLSAIKDGLENNNAKSILAEYGKYAEKQKQEKIEVLKRAIETTSQLFAYNETKELYNKLIIEEPTAVNYFNFAYFLQKYNYIDDALANYEEALTIYRKLAKENTRTYLPYVANTLNNLAILQEAKNEFPQALANYEEALKIYRDLAKENPRTYLPYVAMTLNNLANLQKDKNDFPQALANYEEALTIYRKLAKENTRVYDIYYAKSLIIGVKFFKKTKTNLSLAREILLKYKGIPKADVLLKLIDELK